MGKRSPDKEVLERLSQKTLDAQFRTIITHGLNCSLFEAEAVLEAVKEVYFPFLDAALPARSFPGKVSLVVTSDEEPAGKAIRDCEKRTVCLSLHRGEEDDHLLQQEGPRFFRRSRIPDLCQEALSQGGLLTREDLAYRLFFVGLRTISRDLNYLREERPDLPIPLRSTVHDIGPVLSHRVAIVRLALAGKTSTEICSCLRHSPSAVSNYISIFARTAFLARSGLHPGQISFLLHRGQGLIRQYLEVMNECEVDRNMTYHLEELIRLEEGGKKNTGGEVR